APAGRGRRVSLAHARLREAGEGHATHHQPRSRRQNTRWGSEAMDDEDDEGRGPRAWPGWVSVGLWGLPGRAWAWAFFWLSLLLAVGCTAYGFIDWRFFAGTPLVLSALWYYAAIRWVDRHGEWP